MCYKRVTEITSYVMNYNFVSCRAVQNTVEAPVTNRCHYFYNCTLLYVDLGKGTLGCKICYYSYPTIAKL